MFLAGNFTYAHSRNIGKLFPQGGAEIELLGSVADKSLSGDASLVWDATPAIRFGLSGQYTQVRYLARASAQQSPTTSAASCRRSTRSSRSAGQATGRTRLGSPIGAGRARRFLARPARP